MGIFSSIKKGLLGEPRTITFSNDAARECEITIIELRKKTGFAANVVRFYEEPCGDGSHGDWYDIRMRKPLLEMKTLVSSLPGFELVRDYVPEK